MPTYLPLHANTKRPSVSGWAEPDYAGVEPGDNVGLRLDGYAVVDCETFEAGEAFLAEHPTPYVVRTRRGLHLYYAAAEGQKSRPIVPGLIDLKTGKGSYVLPAGALHPSGARYAVMGDLLLPAPADLPALPVATIERIAVKRAAKTPLNPYDESPITEGGREAELMRLGGAWRRQGLGERGLVFGLHEVNVARCQPPLPDSAIKRMAGSLMQYEPEPDAPDYQLADEIDVPAGYVSRLHTFEQRRDLPPMVWSIEHVLPETGLAQIYGASYTGKSLVALDLLLRMANGVAEWYGHPINVYGPVVYVMMEGVFDSRARIAAWLTAHPGTADSNLYTLDEEAVDLASLESIARIEQDIAALDIEPVLIVVDTQSLATPGTDENSNTEMNTVLSNLKQWSHRRHCPILTVHHTGKDPLKGSRGASAMFAGLDTVIEVRPDQLKVTKVKGYKPTGYMTFDITPSADSVWAEPNMTAGVAVKSLGQRILEVIQGAPGQYSKTELKEHFGNTTAFRRDFAILEADGMIEDFHTGIGKGAAERVVWHPSETVWANFDDADDDYDDTDIQHPSWTVHELESGQ